MLRFTNEWLRRKIAGDRDVESDAGTRHPEAPLNRFTVEHGVVHDTLIGRHVNITPDSIEAEGSERLRDYLIRLVARNSTRI